MKLQCTIAISRMVGTELSMEFENLKRSLQAVVKRAKERHPKEGGLGFVLEFSSK
jgi:hypothetical protein